MQKQNIFKVVANEHFYPLQGVASRVTLCDSNVYKNIKNIFFYVRHMHVSVDYGGLYIEAKTIMPHLSLNNQDTISNTMKSSTIWNLQP